MNVFDNQYRTYRIILKILRLWPYDNSIYIWIQRICILMYFLIGIIFQIFMLVKSEISLRNCIVMLSETFPILLCFLRYLHCITQFSYTKVLFNDIRTEEHLLHDSIEKHIQTKYLDISSHIIDIFCWMTFICIVATTIFTLNPVTLDLIMPLNKSRIHYMYFKFLSNDRRTYIDVFMVLNLIIILIFGLLSVTCTESLTNILSYYICRQFRIVSYRLRKIIEDLSMPNLAKIDLKLRDIHRVVDIHCHAIEYINVASNNAASQYLLTVIICILSFSLNFYRLYNAIITMDNPIEILGSALIITYHLVIAFYSNHCGQLIIDSSLGMFNELYASTWYRIPLKAQKLLLFIILRTSMGSELHFSGLFILSYAGFTSMMSSSLSYCAVIYSIQ
ncbi:uncharacterized protein LOC133666005 [Apis cerana]|uniref:uncharacterized protein LOC133666005 n=1 Tax=Apis cerana TaxID=7461 RepID=UPI002B23D107|nr:uncharacterized protein LOC133666005 [Apis cerana]